MNENSRTAKLISALNTVIDCRAKKRAGNIFSRGEPDIGGCFRGKAFFIEIKLILGTISDLQGLELDKWRGSGAMTRVGVWLDDKKGFKMLQPHDRESWVDLAGPVKKLVEESHGCPVVTLDYKTLTNWLCYSLNEDQ